MEHPGQIIYHESVENTPDIDNIFPQDKWMPHQPTVAWLHHIDPLCHGSTSTTHHSLAVPYQPTVPWLYLKTHRGMAVPYQPTVVWLYIINIPWHSCTLSTHRAMVVPNQPTVPWLYLNNPPRHGSTSSTHHGKAVPYFYHIAPDSHCALVVALSEKRKYHSVCMTIGNEELMHECFPKHLSMGTAWMK